MEQTCRFGSLCRRARQAGWQKRTVCNRRKMELRPCMRRLKFRGGRGRVEESDVMSTCAREVTGYEARLRQCRARICSCCACNGREQNLRTFERRSWQRTKRNFHCYHHIHKSSEVEAAGMKTVADREQDSWNL